MSSESSQLSKVLDQDNLPFGLDGLIGTVVAIQANYYWVRLDTATAIEEQQDKDIVEGKKLQPVLLCTRRSLLKKIGQRVIVGDRVQVEEPDWVEKRGVVSQVLPRQSELDRPPIANADQIFSCLR